MKLNKNAQDPRWRIPVDLPSVKPADYDAAIGSGNGSAAASKRDTKDGTIGFSRQLAGHGKAGHSHTSSFGAGPPDYTLPGYPSGEETAKQEKASERDSTTSIINRVGNKENQH